MALRRFSLKDEKKSEAVFLVVLISEKSILVSTNKISNKIIHVGRLARQRRNTQTRIRHGLETGTTSRFSRMFHRDD
jgi:hypothetical protein